MGTVTRPIVGESLRRLAPGEQREPASAHPPSRPRSLASPAKSDANPAPVSRQIADSRRVAPPTRPGEQREPASAHPPSRPRSLASAAKSDGNPASVSISGVRLARIRHPDLKGNKSALTPAGRRGWSRRAFAQEGGRWLEGTPETPARATLPANPTRRLPVQFPIVSDASRGRHGTELLSALEFDRNECVVASRVHPHRGFAKALQPRPPSPTACLRSGRPADVWRGWVWRRINCYSRGTRGLTWA